MDRRTIPRIGMIDYGAERLRSAGFVALPFARSSVLDPKRLDPHYHDFFQVSLLSGPAGLMHDFREARVDGETLLFLSPGQVHTVRPGPGMAGTIVSFTREFFEAGSEYPDGHLLELPFFHATDALPWLALDASAGEQAARVFREMQRESDHGGVGSQEIARALLTILFVRATRWYAAERPAVAPGRSASLVRKFHQEVENHHREWQALGCYARLLGVTANHLNDVLREETGTSAGEHIRLRRVLAAKRLLLYSELSVAEISYRLGFKDPSYFGRFFRRYENVTPGEFRERIREKYQKDAG